MLTILRIGVMIMLSSVLQSAQMQQPTDPWVHLSTLWDAPGNIEDISPNSRYAIIAQANTSRVVDVATGEIVATVQNGGFRFSPSGRYLIESVTGIDETIIRDLETGTVTAVEGRVYEYLAEDRYVVATQRSATEAEGIQRLIEVSTGRTIVEYTGNVSFSEDARLVAVTYFDEDRTSTTTKLLEIATGAILGIYSYDSPRQGAFGVYTGFLADDQFLFIRHVAGTVKMIDISSGKLLYENRFGFYFSPDWRYVVTGNGDNYDVEVQLIEASTGVILDRVVGNFYFSSDSRYVFRLEMVSFDVYRTRVIDLNTFDTVFEIGGDRIFSAPQFVNENLIQTTSHTYPTSDTHYYDFLSGELVYEVAGSATRYGDVLLFWGTRSLPFRSMQMWQSQNTVAYGTQIEVAPNRQYALVSNGLFVDVYGREGLRSTSTPPPRPPQGVARTHIGEIHLYNAPNASEPLVIRGGNMLNHTYLFVLGQAEQGAWLYVKTDYNSENYAPSQTVFGWIQREDVFEIVSWADVPVLNSDQPLEMLRTIAFQ